uniref:Uncharacterized protein n=1 Tax=Plectus sambesii TaxID=2011161 RepID=A0A914V3L3_9BILA
ERKRYCRGVGGGEKEEGAEGDGGEKEETSCCRCTFEAPRKSPSPADNDSSSDTPPRLCTTVAARPATFRCEKRTLPGESAAVRSAQPGR